MLASETFLGHLYNVRSDREVGFIDRHNYGGGNMLVSPGRGLLSAGMQQVADRPFALSEWAGGGVYDGMEMVPVIGFIGMGVQGVGHVGSLCQQRAGGWQSGLRPVYEPLSVSDRGAGALP